MIVSLSRCQWDFLQNSMRLMLVRIFNIYNCKMTMNFIDTSFVWSVGDPTQIIDIPEGMKLVFNYYDQHEAIVVFEAPRKNVAFFSR